MKYILFLSLLVFSQFSLALNPEEQQPDEVFSSYFARLTRGGSFPGIYLKAPDQFATQFHTYIRKNFWMGSVERARKELESKNFNLWFDVYRTEAPQKFLTFKNVDKNIQTFCQSPPDYKNLAWKNWPTCLRRAWIEEALFDQSTAQNLAQLYKLDLKDVRARTDIMLLNKSDFEKKLREAGWGGPVYFRGATMPDPKDARRRWILLNDDFLKQYTSFEYPVLQLFEIAGIANHELSHVMQDFLGQSLGLDIQVRSAEQVLLIEGQAEYLAEQSFKNTGIFYDLFASEQAVEVVNREGNMAEFFPYTIGLPFVSTIYKTQSDSYQVTLDLIGILGKDTSVADYLKVHY